MSVQEQPKPASIETPNVPSKGPEKSGMTLQERVKRIVQTTEIAMIVTPAVLALLFGFLQTDPSARSGILTVDGMVAFGLLVDRVERLIRNRNK